ncbi:hypothetical protein QLX67_02725 [Balneolaceae bacterium ANBcel3]|nr:hypothetical protein [Balneolaceae bacterium ANBcel3]
MIPFFILLLAVSLPISENKNVELREEGMKSETYEYVLERGVQLFYQGKWTQAGTIFSELADANDDDIRPAFFRSMPSFWTYFFTGQSPHAANEFLSYSQKALNTGEKQLRSTPGDTTSILMMGGLYGYRALIAASEKKYRIAVQSGVGGFSYTRRLLAMDQNHMDALIGQGVFQYMMGTVPREIQWATRLAGMSGDREKGLEMLEKVAASETPTRTDARMILAYIYKEEQKYDDMIRLTRNLISEWPENPVFLFYHAKAQEKIGYRDEAKKTYLSIAEIAGPEFEELVLLGKKQAERILNE